MILTLLLLLQDGPWDAFKEGSFITTKQERRGVDKADFFQVVTLEKNGLLRTSTQKPSDKRFKDEGTEAVPAVQPLIEGWKETGRRREKLSVGARELDCTVIDYEMDFRTMTIWRADGVALPSRSAQYWKERVALPADLVKLESQTRKNEVVETFKVQVHDLSVVIPVGIQRVECSVEELRYTATQPGKDMLIRSTKRWFCEGIPGHVARREESCHAGEGGYDITVQVLTFKAVR